MCLCVCVHMHKCTLYEYGPVLKRGVSVERKPLIFEGKAKHRGGEVVRGAQREVAQGGFSV